MLKEEFISILKKERQRTEIELKLHSNPSYSEFYGLFSRVTTLDYVISLAEKLEC